MKIRIASVAVALVLTACGGGNVGEDPSAETTPATEVTATTDSSAAEETSTTTSQDATTSPSTKPEEESVGDDKGKISSAAQLDGAREDLARRLDIGPAEIEVVTQEEIVWRNGALGCPEPGMMYTQALVDGSLVILEVDGKQYEYHGKVGEPLRYCPDPAPRK